MKSIKITDIKKPITDWELGELKEYGDKWKHDNKRVVVFVSSPDRPLRQGKILEDFAWRRNHEAPLSPTEILELVGPYLKQRGFEIINAFYSRKAGCSMCPCSPGYIVRVQPYHGKWKAVWLTHKQVRINEDAEKQRREQTREYEKEVAQAFNVTREAVL